MQTATYCRSCRRDVDPDWANCPHCGANQLAAIPISSVPPASVPAMRLAEYTRQYETLNWVAFAGFFLLGAYFAGFAMIAYAFIQKSALRQKVAALGVDPDAWEYPLRQQAARLMWAGLLCLLVIGLLMAGFIAYFAHQTSQMSVQPVSAPYP